MSPAPGTTSSAATPVHTSHRAIARGGSGSARASLARGVLAVAVCASLTGCAAILAPGAEPRPAPGAAPGVVSLAIPVERAPSAGPTSVGAIQGEHNQETATVDVQAAPNGSASRGKDRETLPGEGADAGSGTGAGSGAGEDGTGAGSGGGAGSGAAAPDLTDAVQYAKALEEAVNGYRTANGLAALAHDDCAYDVALARAQALVGEDLAHAPLGPIFDACPTTAVAENLAKGGWTPAEAAQGWMDSEGHRANILNGDLTRGAIACVPDGGDPAAPVMICAHVFLA
ncbi:CAP domain-containing protein [Promicromonospora kroppenstedtii]|uniref:CAP domain-containing protein n=1 Tax=Promicromonospora kroppenstedtii TaxID=440482 RepID=A0ABW7XKU4_9MICO